MDELLKAAEVHRDDIVAFLRDILAIPSPSTKEAEVVKRIKTEMQRLGFYHIYTDEIGNIVTDFGNQDGKRLLFDSHIDTVGIGDPKSWPFDPFKGKVENGFIYGRGAGDNKGAMASMLFGAKLLMEKKIKLAGMLHIAGVVQEEDCDGYAAGLLCQRLKPKAVVLGEATDLQIYLGHRGRIEFTVTTRGESCHASAPHRGKNAIYRMSPLVNGIESLNERFMEESLLGKGTIAVTRIESTSGSLNVVPDSCTIYIDRRLTTGEDEELAIAQVDQIARLSGVRIETDVLRYQAKSHTGYPCDKRKYFPSWSLPENHDLVQISKQAIRKALNYEPAIGYWGFSTDGVATMGELGIPTIGFGPGNEHDAHTVNDRVKIDDLVKAAAGYAQLAVDILGVE
jgi:putative selenium metabolism hydrolase